MFKNIKKFCEIVEKPFFKTIDQLTSQDKKNFNLIQSFYNKNTKQKSVSRKQQQECLQTIRQIDLITLKPQQNFEILKFLSQQKTQNFLFSECQSKISMCIQNLLNQKFLEKERTFQQKFDIYLELFFTMGSCLVYCEQIFTDFEKFLLQKNKEELEWFFVSQRKIDEMFCIVWCYNKLGALKNYKKLFEILFQIMFKNYACFLKNYFDILKIIYTNNLDKEWFLEKQILKTFLMQIKNFEESDIRHYTFKKSGNFVSIYLNLFPELAIQSYNGPFSFRYDEINDSKKYEFIKVPLTKIYQKSKVMIDQQKVIKDYSPYYFEYRKSVFFITSKSVLQGKANETEEKLFNKIIKYFQTKYTNFLYEKNLQFFQYEYDFVMQVNGILVVMELNGFQHYLREVYFNEKDQQFKYRVSDKLDKIQIDRENQIKKFGVDLYYNLKWTHYMGRKQLQETLDKNFDNFLKQVENDLKQKLDNKQFQ